MTLLRKQEQRDKHLLKLEREHNRLFPALRDAPLVPLEKPYQLGWIKTYALVAEVLRRPDAAVFRRVLAVVNSRVWSREANFKLRNGDAIVLRPRIIPPKEWERLGWPASHKKLFSYGHWEDEMELRPWFRKRRLRIGYAVNRPWWIKEEVHPRMITHRRVDLPDVRSRLAEIDAHFDHHQGWAILGRLHGHRVRWLERTSIAERRIAIAYSIHENS
jgi:hypothetical protein